MHIGVKTQQPENCEKLCQILRSTQLNFAIAKREIPNTLLYCLFQYNQEARPTDFLISEYCVVYVDLV